MSEPRQQQQQQQPLALPAWATNYQDRQQQQRQDRDALSYQEYDDMDLWADDDIATTALPAELPPVQDYLGLIQQTRKEIEDQAQRRQQHQTILGAMPPIDAVRGRGAGGATANQRQGVGRERAGGRGGPGAIPLDLGEVNIIDKEKKKPRKPIPRLDVERLLSEQGLPRLRKYGETFKIRRKYTTDSEKRANAKENLARMMAMCQTWGDNLFPKATFQDFISMAESKCKSEGRIKVTMSTWRDEYFDQERLKREELEEQRQKEAELASAEAAATEIQAGSEKEMAFSSLFPMENGTSSSSSANVTSKITKDFSSSTSPYSFFAGTEPSNSAAVGRTPDKSRTLVALDDSEDDDPSDGYSRSNNFKNSSSNGNNRQEENDDEEDGDEDMESDSDEDVASMLNRLRQQRMARLANMRGGGSEQSSSAAPSASATGNVSSSSNSADPTDEMATQPLDHEDDDEEMDLLPPLIDKSDNAATNDHQQSRVPEEDTVVVSSQRRRRRLIVDESDDE